MLKLRLPYHCVYDEVRDVLEAKYIDNGSIEPENIDYDRDIEIIALKLADEVLADKEIWSLVVQDIKDICLDHAKKQQKIFSQRSGNTNKELKERIEENDCNLGKLLLTMISSTIYDAVANNCWEQIQEAEREVIKKLYVEKREMYRTLLSS